MQLRGQPRELPRIRPEHRSAEGENDLPQRRTPRAFDKFGPPGEALIGDDLEERERPPTAIGPERPQIDDAHVGYPPLGYYFAHESQGSLVISLQVLACAAVQASGGTMRGATLRCLDGNVQRVRRRVAPLRRDRPP